jgi:hypothetical protein
MLVFSLAETGNQAQNPFSEHTFSISSEKPSPKPFGKSH